MEFDINRTTNKINKKVLKGVFKYLFNLIAGWYFVHSVKKLVFLFPFIRCFRPIINSKKCDHHNGYRNTHTPIDCFSEDKPVRNRSNKINEWILKRCFK